MGSDDERGGAPDWLSTWENQRLGATRLNGRSGDPEQPRVVAPGARRNVKY